MGSPSSAPPAFPSVTRLAARLTVALPPPPQRNLCHFCLMGVSGSGPGAGWDAGI